MHRSINDTFDSEKFLQDYKAYLIRNKIAPTNADYMLDLGAGTVNKLMKGKILLSLRSACRIADHGDLDLNKYIKGYLK